MHKALDLIISSKILFVDIHEYTRRLYGLISRTLIMTNITIVFCISQITYT